MSKRVKMYLKGRVITDISALVLQVKKNKYVFHGDNPMHPGWLCGMPLRHLMFTLERKHFFYARKNPKYKELPF